MESEVIRLLCRRAQLLSGRLGEVEPVSNTFKNSCGRTKDGFDIHGSDKIFPTWITRSNGVVSKEKTAFLESASSAIQPAHRLLKNDKVVNSRRELAEGQY